jgi:hypothetical protein
VLVSFTSNRVLTFDCLTVSDDWLVLLSGLRFPQVGHWVSAGLSVSILLFVFGEVLAVFTIPCSFPEDYQPFVLFPEFRRV